MKITSLLYGPLFLFEYHFLQGDQQQSQNRSLHLGCLHDMSVLKPPSKPKSILKFAGLQTRDNVFKTLSFLIKNGKVS